MSPTFNETPICLKEPISALDVGCAVGRSCFELSKYFDQVVGIDYSVNFVDACNRVLKEKVIDYECTLEGSNTQKCVAELEPGVVCTFYQFCFVNKLEIETRKIEIPNLINGNY